VEVRYSDEKNSRAQFALFVNGQQRGAAWESAGTTGGWATKQIDNVALNVGDDIRVDMQGAGVRIDYVQLNE
jgi:hypothetical protein